MVSFFRVIKFAFQDAARNAGLSFMIVLILVLMLLSVNTLMIVNVLTQEATQSIKNQIDVSIFFNADATTKQVQEIESVIKSFPEVVSLNFIDKDQVLVNFKEQHKADPEILASLDELGGNPLGPTLVLKTKEPGDYQKIITALSVPEYQNLVEAKSFDDTEMAINKISVITKQVEKFVLALSVLFAAVAFLIILNTIRVSIYTQRIEIAIKKLVGATNWFVRGPYLVESLIFSVISVGITFGFVALALHFVDPYVTIIFGRTSILTNYFLSHIMLLSLAQFGAVLALTVLSSLLAMRKYLRA